jgi:hypothetical protein
MALLGLMLQFGNGRAFWDFFNYRHPNARFHGRFEARQICRGLWPPIKIVATSGFVNVGKDDLLEGGRFVPKPYRPERIVAALRELTAAA